MKLETIVHDIPPLYDAESRVLLLGSLPSPKSREAHFFYGHPRNRFWPLLATLLGTAVPCTVEEKTALVCAHGLALWDTVQQCTITGAQDASIRNVTPTDIPRLCAAAPIRRVLCNGAAAYSLCVKYHTLPGVQVVKLPSTSPANAAWTMDKLRAAWGPYF